MVLQMNKVANFIDNWKTRLRIDALYFHAARQANFRADESLPKITKAEKFWESLVINEKEILSRYKGDHLKAYDELEPIAIQMESAHSELGEAYAPLFKEVATVHILIAACLEAHINSLAEEKLNGKELEYFHNIALEAKWLFLPQILGLSGFNVGTEPFQRFSVLIKYRNNLIHYKKKEEKWQYGVIPDFTSKLGLKLKEARLSILCAEKMITVLSKQLKLDPPYWLRSDLNKMDYFDTVD